MDRDRIVVKSFSWLVMVGKFLAFIFQFEFDMKGLENREVGNTVLHVVSSG